MSKMDNLRAMREARHAEMVKRAAAATTKPAARPPVAPPAIPARRRAAAVEPASAEGGAGEVCGHRNMSGRTCTREHGHAAKTHRYS